MRLLSGGTVCLFLPIAAFAQSDRGTITGTVQDPAGGVVPTAAVVAHHAETGSQYQTTTTSTGNYALPQLPLASYDLTVEAPGLSFVDGGA